jgi:hypothetical protein
MFEESVIRIMHTLLCAHGDVMTCMPIGLDQPQQGDVSCMQRAVDVISAFVAYCKVPTNHTNCMLWLREHCIGKVALAQSSTHAIENVNDARRAPRPHSLIVLRPRPTANTCYG